MMNSESKLIAAIDIGTTKVVAVVGRKLANGSVEVLGIEKTPSNGVKKGVISNINETVNAIRLAVTGLEARLDIHITDVYVGMAGYAMKSFSNRTYKFIEPNKEISSFDLEQLRNDSFRMSLDPGEKIVHVIPQDYTVDNESGEKYPVGMSGHRLEGFFHVVIGRMSIIKDIEKCIHRAGLNLSGIILESLASSHGVLTEEEMEAGVVMIDIGGGTTDFALYYDGIIRHTATIPFGGNTVTSDIKEGCSVLHKQAEILKVQFGSAIGSMAREDMVVAIPGMPGWESKEISFQNLAFIIQARMEEIIEYIAYHIDKSGYYDKLGAGIVLTGGGALLKNLAQLVKLKTGLDVRVGQPGRFIPNDALPETDQTIYSTAVGLLMSSSMYSTPKVLEQRLFDADEDLAKVESSKQKNNSKGKTVKSRIKKEAGYITGDLFGNIRKNITSIFEEKDVEM